jgi:nucleoid-associated protein YgaU
MGLLNRKDKSKAAWRRIYDANRDQLENPDVIHPGQELKLPAKDGGAA